MKTVLRSEVAEADEGRAGAPHRAFCLGVHPGTGPVRPFRPSAWRVAWSGRAVDSVPSAGLMPGHHPFPLGPQPGGSGGEAGLQPAWD